MLQYALLALSAVQAISSIKSGYEQNTEANYNADLLNQKAGMFDIKSGIENTQYEQAKKSAYSTSMANIGAMGITPQGSALAVMLHTQKQIMIDQVIAKFNNDQSKKFTQAEADAQRRSGKAAIKSGYTNAFTSILSGVSNYGMYTKGIKK